jgi:pyruvate-formate lyase
MTDRIKKLREQSLNAVNRISAERAMLITEFYQSKEALEASIPVQRALSFKYIMENKSICINEGELIVGERGPAPKATPTYPEICLHTTDDLDILDARQKVSFKVDQETRNAYETVIIPFWKGRTNRERIFKHMDQPWIDSYGAGIFTEFQEQRAPGHTVLGGKIYRQGMLDIMEDVQKAIHQLDFLNDPQALDKLEELKAMDITARAIIRFAERHGEVLEQLAELEENPTRRKELEDMRKICRKVPANRPECFHEALQYYWFVHLGVITEMNPWDSFNPGRLDQHLLHFYEQGIQDGSLSADWAREILQSFWIKFNNHPSPPKVGVTAEESNTYTDFCLINLGGLTEDGRDGVNDLTYLILDVVEEMRLLQPSSMVQISKKNPDRFVERTVKIVKTGFGQPSIFNTDAIVQELLRQGKSLEDARNGGASGCVESGAFGTEAYILTGYFNLVKVLEITLNNGVDPKSGKLVGLKTGDPSVFSSFDELLNAFKTQLNYFIDIKIKGNNIIERIFSKYMPVPFLSQLVDDCISNGKDYNAGGARYNSSYIQGVGLGSITDMLTSLKYHLFDQKTFSWIELKHTMDANFNGFDQMRAHLVYDTPKYGNDDDYADELAHWTFEAFYDAVNGRPSPRGATYRINMLPTTCPCLFWQGHLCHTRRSTGWGAII